MTEDPTMTVDCGPAGPPRPVDIVAVGRIADPVDRPLVRTTVPPVPATVEDLPPTGPAAHAGATRTGLARRSVGLVAAIAVALSVVGALSANKLLRPPAPGAAAAAPQSAVAPRLTAAPPPQQRPPDAVTHLPSPSHALPAPSRAAPVTIVVPPALPGVAPPAASASPTAPPTPMATRTVTTWATVTVTATATPTPPQPLAPTGGFTAPAAGRPVTERNITATGWVRNYSGELFCFVLTQAGDYWPYWAVVANDRWTAYPRLGPQSITEAKRFILVLATATDEATEAIRSRLTNTDGIGPTPPTGVEELARIEIARIPLP